MLQPEPEQLTLDGRSVPCDRVAKDLEDQDRGDLEKVQRGIQRAVRDALRPDQKETK